MNNYIYIFTRQDMIPEQQAVQTGHATLKLGCAMGKYKNDAAPIGWNQLRYSNPNDTHFTLVGVRNLEALTAVATILEKFGFDYETFIEPDMNNEPTSIALYPIPEDKRSILMAFNLLKMGK